MAKRHSTRGSIYALNLNNAVFQKIMAKAKREKYYTTYDQ